VEIRARLNVRSSLLRLWWVTSLASQIWFLALKNANQAGAWARIGNSDILSPGFGPTGLT
jgi:hypothetical protein